MPPTSVTRATPLRIAVTDVYTGFTPLRHPVVKVFAAAMGLEPEHFARKRSEVARADVVLYSVFGSDHLLSRGTNVALSAEPTIRDGAADWTIDWRYLERDSHTRIPVWAYEFVGRADELRQRPDPTSDDPASRRFCNFIYSNPHCGMRNAFFSMLNRKQRVDALGSVLNNASHPLLSERMSADWPSTKQQVLRDYRFTIAFENEEHPGYVTEKMTHAWASGSVPVYWGDPIVDHDFPPGSYLSLYEAGSATRLVEQVLEAHHDPARYAELRAANPFRTGHMATLASSYTDSLTRCAQAVSEDAERFRGRARLHPLRRVSRIARFAKKEARGRVTALVRGR